jgi:1-acyl-sn-glycerol-3-phosphate acyltransferase
VRTIFAYLGLLILTPLAGGAALLGALFRMKHGEGSIYDMAIRGWGRGLIWASGVTVVVHGEAHRKGKSQIFVANHVSQHDILALASVLHNYKFVAKAELSRIPFFGAAARAAGTIYIDRHKRRSSFETYREAAARIGEGASVVVFAEGTRGDYYALRPFKKGPIVLAISAKAPIIPTVVHGTLEVRPRGTLWVLAGRVDIHFLEPVSVEGMTYEDRNQLATTVRDRMATLLRDTYGVESQPWEARKSPAG